MGPQYNWRYDGPAQVTVDAATGDLRMTSNGYQWTAGAFIGGDRDDQATAVAIAADGGMIVAGDTNTFYGGEYTEPGDSFVARFTPGGQLVRFDTWGTAETDEQSVALVVDVTGQATTLVQQDSSTDASRRVLLLDWAATGGAAERSTLATGDAQTLYATDMVVDHSGNIYAAVGGNATIVFLVPTGAATPSAQIALNPASLRLAVDGNNDVYALGQLFQQSSYVAKIDSMQTEAVIPPPVAPEPPFHTVSYYQQTVDPAITQQQGCASRFRGEQGIVILDYGAPRQRGSTTNPEYGTQLIQNPDSLDQVANFVSMTQIISAVQSFADGYYRVQRCPQFDRNDPDSINPVPAKLVIALGIHNGPTREDSTTRAALNADHGTAWADMVVQLQQYMNQQRYNGIQVAGAYDAEPDWADLYTSRAATLDWARGFTAKNIVNGQSGAIGVTYYNFGSLEGGYRTDEWITKTAADTRNMDFVYDLSQGFPGAQALPQIYNAAYAKEWYHLSYYSFTNKPTPLRIAGVLTECASSGCAANFTALQAQSWPLYKLDLLNTNGAILDFAPRQGWLALWDTLHRTQIQDVALPANLRLTDGFVFTLDRRPQAPQVSGCQSYIIPYYPDGRLPEPRNRYAPDQYVDVNNPGAGPQPSCLPAGTVFPESSTFSSQFALPMGTSYFFNPLTGQELPWSTDIAWGPLS